MSEANFVYLTKERLVELEKELQELKTSGRKEIAAKIAEARAHGDLSENAEYDAAKEEQGLFELRISKLENVLSRARIIDTSQFPEDQAHILSKVYIRNTQNKKEFEYILVSPEEADFQAGKISVTSPSAAYALANAVQSKEDRNIIFDLASGGFNSTVRLAKSSSTMWHPIFQQNRNYVVESLDVYIKHLKEFRDCLHDKQDDKLHDLIVSANKIRGILEGENPHLVKNEERIVKLYTK
ncbi:MAG: transcription elongation factor GreA [Ignavibacteriaceae bacterium]